MNHEIQQLYNSSPPVSRLWKLLLSIIPLIPDESSVQLQQLLHEYSLPVQLFNVKQFFQCLHLWLTFEERLTCMAVNHEWRAAIRQPELWFTCFGTGNNNQIFPSSCKFIRSMLPCWTQLKQGVDIELSPANKTMENALHLWLDLVPNVRVRSLTLSSIYLAPLNINLITKLMPRISTGLIELNLLSAVNYQMIALQHFEFPALEILKAYVQFSNCFVNARNLKRLNMVCHRVAYDLLEEPICTPAECFPSLEIIQFKQSLTQDPVSAGILEYYHSLQWPTTVRRIELIGSNLFLLLLYLYHAAQINPCNVALELVCDFNGSSLVQTDHSSMDTLQQYVSNSYFTFQTVHLNNFKCDEFPLHDKRNMLNRLINRLRRILQWNKETCPVIMINNKQYIMEDSMFI